MKNLKYFMEFHWATRSIWVYQIDVTEYGGFWWEEAEETSKDSSELTNPEEKRSEKRNDLGWTCEVGQIESICLWKDHYLIWELISESFFLKIRERKLVDIIRDVEWNWEEVCNLDFDAQTWFESISSSDLRSNSFVCIYI